MLPLALSSVEIVEAAGKYVGIMPPEIHNVLLNITDVGDCICYCVDCISGMRIRMQPVQEEPAHGIYINSLYYMGHSINAGLLATYLTLSLHSYS